MHPFGRRGVLFLQTRVRSGKGRVEMSVRLTGRALFGSSRSVEIATFDPDLAEMNSRHYVISDFGGKCVVANEVIDPKNGDQNLRMSLTSSLDAVGDRFGSISTIVLSTCSRFLLHHRMAGVAASNLCCGPRSYQIID